MNNQIIDIKGLLPPPSFERAEKPASPTVKKPRLLKILSVAFAVCGALTMSCAVLVALSGLAKNIRGGIPALFFPASNSGVEAYEKPEDSADLPTDTLSAFVPSEPDETENIYAYDAADIPEGYQGIVPYDLSTSFLVSRPYLSNATSYTPDIETLKTAEYPLKPVSKLAEVGEPTVLIIHTHGTEAYSEDGINYFSETENLPRSTDISQNVVAVGAVMTEQLLKRGISTLHCTIMHDEESYKDSYNRSAETIAKYLVEYPSIKYVFDVHRDSVIRGDGDKIRPISLCGGETVAQVMSVVGTDELGADYPNWEKNLTLALRLHTAIEEKYGQISRPVNLRGAAFNEEYSEASLLLEIGSCGNTLKEAKKAGIIVADCLADLIISGNGDYSDEETPAE